MVNEQLEKEDERRGAGGGEEKGEAHALTLLLRTGTGFGLCGLNPFLRFCNKQKAVNTCPNLLETAITPLLINLP